MNEIFGSVHLFVWCSPPFFLAMCSIFLESAFSRSTKVVLFLSPALAKKASFFGFFVHWLHIFALHLGGGFILSLAPTENSSDVLLRLFEEGELSRLVPEQAPMDPSHALLQKKRSPHPKPCLQRSRCTCQTVFSQYFFENAKKFTFF